MSGSFILIWLFHSYQIASTTGILHAAVQCGKFTEDEIDFVWQEGKVSDAIQDVVALGEIIQCETQSRLLSLALKSYEAGRPIAFTPLEVSQSGLNNGHATVPWHEITKVRIERGLIIVNKEGKRLPWCSVSVS